MHVMFLDDGVMVRAVGMGLCEKLEAESGAGGAVARARC